MKGFLKSLLIVVFLFGLVALVTFFSDPIKKYITQKLQTESKHVLGISVSSYQQSGAAKAVQKNLNTDFKAAQTQVLHINIADVLNTFSQTKKIINDANALKLQFNDQLKKLAK